MDKSIEERATEYSKGQWDIPTAIKAYIAGATEQKAIDDELCRSGEASDGYHTFNELYDFRREYNAALVNSGVWKAHKSYRHHSGELCFDGGWFIVMIETPFGQISNHYENKYWNEFHCEEKELADEWDGHTEKDVIARLMKCNNQNRMGGIVMKPTLDFRDDLIDKEVAEKLSKEVSSYIIEQVKHNMDKSIEERVKEYSKEQWDELTAKKAYISGAKEQKAIDEEVRLKKCDDMTEAEYNREAAFVDWYLENGKGTPTFSDAIEWARKKTINDACEWLKARNVLTEASLEGFRKAMEE